MKTNCKTSEVVTKLNYHPPGQFQLVAVIILFTVTVLQSLLSKGRLPLNEIFVQQRQKKSKENSSNSVSSGVVLGSLNQKSCSGFRERLAILTSLGKPGGRTR